MSNQLFCTINRTIGKLPWFQVNDQCWGVVFKERMFGSTFKGLNAVLQSVLYCPQKTIYHVNAATGTFKISYSDRC